MQCYPYIIIVIFYHGRYYPQQSIFDNYILQLYLEPCVWNRINANTTLDANEDFRETVYYTVLQCSFFVYITCLKTNYILCIIYNCILYNVSRIVSMVINEIQLNSQMFLKIVSKSLKMQGVHMHWSELNETTLRRASNMLHDSFIRNQIRVVHGLDRPAGRVGSGRVTILSDFGGSGRVSTSDFLVFYWLFLGTWIDMNLRILHSDWLIFYDI